MRVTIGFLSLLGVSALGGGLAMILGLGEGSVMPPEAWLEDIPVIDSWIVPGLVLGIGFGLGSLITAYGMTRRPRWAWLGDLEDRTGHQWPWLATILIGSGQVVWIGLEMVYLPELSWLQPFYGGIGLLLLALPFTSSVRDYLHRR